MIDYFPSICYSILNSLVIVLFLSGMIGMILLRTLHRDITRYNQLIDSGVSLRLSILCLQVRKTAESHSNNVEA